MEGRRLWLPFSQLLITGSVYAAQNKQESSQGVWILACFGILVLILCLVFVITVWMLSFFYCRKWMQQAVSICCCCPSNDEEENSTEEQNKLIAGTRPNPLIRQQEPQSKKNSITDDSDDEHGKDKVRRFTHPTAPSIMVTSASTPRSRSPSLTPSSRASSPRPPAFDIVTDPSNPLLLMK